MKTYRVTIQIDIQAPSLADANEQVMKLNTILSNAFNQNVELEMICPNTGLPCLPKCNQEPCLGMNKPLNQWNA